MVGLNEWMAGKCLVLEPGMDEMEDLLDAEWTWVGSGSG